MASTRLLLDVALVLLSVQTCSGSSRGFLSGGSVQAEQLLKAMDEMLGCGGGLSHDHFAAIESELAPMWRALPKLVEDRAEWRSLRYVAHRYFVQTSSLLVRGFEPGKLVDSPVAGHAAILNNHTPAFVQGLMAPARAARGFSLNDAVYFVATLEQIIFHSESSLLETVYAARNQDARQSVGYDDLSHIVGDYMIHWLIGDNEGEQESIDENPDVWKAAVPHWSAIKHYADGLIKSLDFKRQRSPEGHRGQDLMSSSYSFDDAHEVVGSITHTFGSFWQSECDTMKRQLVDMDTDGFGRVRLADFYGTGLEKDWRFAESKAYLRDMGALDESSPSTPRVMVANYMQAATNCVVNTRHYMVCCANECEGILTEIEDTIGSPTASPDQILKLVGNMSSPSSPDDDSPKLDGTLTTQLYQIAYLHGEKVPLHGRLFSQWLHYVFPHECVFPHKTGVASYRTPQEFAGDGSFIASKEEMLEHVNGTDQTELPLNETSTEDLWMQWTPEIEEIADDSLELRAPESLRAFSWGSLAFPAVILALVAFMGFGVRSSKAVEGDFRGGMRVHIV